MTIPPEWDVARDDDGEPITLTPAQVGAVWHAISVVNQVRLAESHPSIWEAGSPHAELFKSRLLGRMLIDGRPPLETKPGRYVAAQGYHFVEPDLPHWYFGQVFPVIVVGDGPTPTT